MEQLEILFSCCKLVWRGPAVNRPHLRCLLYFPCECVTSYGCKIDELGTSPAAETRSGEPFMPAKGVILTAPVARGPDETSEKQHSCMKIWKEWPKDIYCMLVNQLGLVFNCLLSCFQRVQNSAAGFLTNTCRHLSIYLYVDIVFLFLSIL